MRVNQPFKILFHMLFETVWIYHDSARTAGRSSQINITGCSDIHKGKIRLQLMQTNSSSWTLCVQWIATSVSRELPRLQIAVFMLPWSQAVQEKMMYLGLELCPPTLRAEHGSERSEMSWLEGTPVLPGTWEVWKPWVLFWNWSGVSEHFQQKSALKSEAAH